MPNQTEILTALSTLILALLGAALLAVTAVLIPWIKARAAAIQYSTAQQIARDAVHETEQLAKAGKLTSPDASTTKLVNAEATARDVAAQYGVKLPRGNVSTLIESNVLAMKQQQQAARQPAVDVSPAVQVTTITDEPAKTTTRTRRRSTPKPVATD